MKASRFNIYIDLKGFSIIYNSLSDRFLGISHSILANLKNEINNVCVIEKESPDVYAKLVQLGMIIEDNFDELAYIQSKYKEEKFHSRRKYLMIYPTQDCNLNCWYCYETHKKGTRMSHDILSLIIAYINREIEDNTFDHLHLGFFGGEPLLNFDQIAYPLANKIKHLCDNYGKTFSSFFVTNASLINEEIAAKIATLNPYFQITIDGDKLKHDKVRVWKNTRKGTYQQIIKAIHLISKYYDPQSWCSSDDPIITLRINYDNHTLRNIQGILDDIADLDRNTIRIHFERVWQTRDAVDEEQRSLLLKTFERFLKERFVISHGVFRRKNISCPSDSNSFLIVNYDGTIHKCNGRTLGINTQEGILQSDGHINWNSTRYNERLKVDTFKSKTCTSCVLLPLCMGPCSQKMLESGGFKPQICSKHSIDMPIEEYLAYEFEMRYFLEHLKI